ncbi:MAG: hypothetical protein IPJ71_19200 [Bdellovibrionales bacterium]|nr:hypothetical protein [Bdellovibrionales bacterium]
MNKEVSRKRLWFNLFYKTYENILGYWMLNFQQMKTATFGTRSFSRILLGGYTWTEGVVTGLRKIGELTSSVPGAQRVTDLCQHFLSNNYTDFEKIQPPKK